MSAGDTALEQFPLNPEDSGLEQFEMSDSSSDTTVIPVSNTSNLVSRLRYCFVKFIFAQIKNKSNILITFTIFANKKSFSKEGMFCSQLTEDQLPSRGSETCYSANIGNSRRSSASAKNAASRDSVSKSYFEPISLQCKCPERS